jgi:hypothetical protein
MTPSETHTAIDLSRICQLQEKPLPFEPGEPLFWTDRLINTGSKPRPMH